MVNCNLTIEKLLMDLKKQHQRNNQHLLNNIRVLSFTFFFTHT